MSSSEELPPADAAFAKRATPATAPLHWAQLPFPRASLVLAITLLFANFFLLSPPRGETYPGAIPWRPFSILRPLIEVLSLNGAVATARGTEIKDFAFHLAAVAALLLLAMWVWRAPAGSLRPRRLTEPWFAAQLLLVGWVVLAMLSGLWSGDPSLAYGQATLLALGLAWAVALAWTLDVRDVPRLLAVLVAASALAAALCLWYYFERNPFHRPGFPVGNPGTLAASLVPALLVASGALANAAHRWRQTGRQPSWPTIVGAVAALVPLVACFALTNSRSALLGLAVGLSALLLLSAGRRMRWVVAAIVLVGLVAGGVWLMSYSRFDAAMARGATIRFRLYAWRYAAELWHHSRVSSIVGHGAGAYTRLAGELSISDRRLDPAAFMGEMVEHAHNELFEVLTEIGLVGGVTFVGGWLATLATGGILARSAARHERRWLLLSLLAAIAALMTDALTSPDLRLVGVPAVFYTLLGTLWALGRAAWRPQAADTIAALVAPAAGSRARLLQRGTAAVAVGALALGAAWMTFRNWSGVLHEEAADTARSRGDFDQAIREFDTAETRLLDPVRRLVDQCRATEVRLLAAREARDAYTSLLKQHLVGGPDPGSQPTSARGDLEHLWRTATERCHSTYDAALQLSFRAPTMLYTAAVGGTAAEMLTELYADARDRARAAEWLHRAWQAWREQRRWRPFDVTTLLALTSPRYPISLPDRLGLLRDALRATEGRDRWGRVMSFSQVQREWHEAFVRVAAMNGFADVLEQFLAVVGPAAPETDLDSLIVSLAPEVYRLAAHYEGLRRNFPAAEDYAARAARLYEPMRPRFPTLHSVALLEQAEFTLSESPNRAPAAIDLLRQAIGRLPQIQQQKYEELVLPFRSELVVDLLAAGQEAEATKLVRATVGSDGSVGAALANAYVGGLVERFIRTAPELRPSVEAWIAAALQHQPDHLGAWRWRAWLAAERGDVQAARRVLAEAARAGVGTEPLRRIRAGLGQEFPALRAQITKGE